MRLFLTLLLVFAGQIIYAQCTECLTIREASKAPEKVVELTVNPNVGGEGLTTFPDTIRSMKNLRILYLTDHGLKSVPSFIGELKQLKELSFAGNRLTKLPDEIFLLTNLQELILSDNLFSADYLAYIKKECKKKLPRTKLVID